MKSMNDMSMKELIETEKRINGIWRLHEDAFPKGMEWAKNIEDDVDYQEASGAWEEAHKCPVCDEWVTDGHAFCSEECKKVKVNGWKLKQAEIRKEETMKFLRREK